MKRKIRAEDLDLISIILDEVKINDKEFNKAKRRITNLIDNIKIGDIIEVKK